MADGPIQQLHIIHNIQVKKNILVTHQEITILIFYIFSKYPNDHDKNLYQRLLVPYKSVNELVS